MIRKLSIYNRNVSLFPTNSFIKSIQALFIFTEIYSLNHVYYIKMIVILRKMLLESSKLNKNSYIFSVPFMKDHLHLDINVCIC